MEQKQILEILRERILAFAASRMGRDQAEDLAQEVLVLLHEKYRHVTALDELLPLALKIIRFKITAQRRKSVRRGEYTQVSVDEVPLADAEPDPETIAERRQLQERLSEAIQQLDGRCRELFRLKLEGRRFGEIQELLNAGSINTVYTWDLRCRKRLLELLGGSWEGKR